MALTSPPEPNEILTPDVIASGVVQRAAMLARGPERSAADWSASWWQVPPRLRRRGGLAVTARSFGWDGAAYLLLAARWSLLTVPCLLISSILLAVTPTPARVVGVISLVAGVLCMAAAARRRLTARHCRNAWMQMAVSESPSPTADLDSP